jgi:hypothetical protein
VDLQELLKTVQEFASQMTSSEGGGQDFARFNFTEYAAAFRSTYDMRDDSSGPGGPSPTGEPEKALGEMDDLSDTVGKIERTFSTAYGPPSADEEQAARTENQQKNVAIRRDARADRTAQRKEKRDKRMDLSDARTQGTKWPESDSIQNLSSIGDGMRDYHTRLMDVLMTMQGILFDGQAKLNEIQARFNRMR